MRKTSCLIIHIAAVLIIIAGLVNLHIYSRDGDGFGWIDSKGFEESLPFSEMVSDDISNLKRFAVLKNAFEEEADGELSEYKLVVTATTANGQMHYRLSELLDYAADYGYTLNEVSHTIVYNEKIKLRTDQNEPYELRIVYKAFDPFFFENTTFGPTQGLTNIRDLSVEAVKAVAEYYQLRSIYETDNTNFVYSLNMDSGDGYNIDLYNTRMSLDAIIALPKYVTVKDNRSIDTNIVPEPEGILSVNNSFDFNWENGDVCYIGIDTNYIYNDRYKRAADDFEKDIMSIRNWMIAIAVCALISVISLILVIRGFDDTDSRELTMDRIPLEALIFLFALASIIIYIIFKLTVNLMLEELFEAAYWEFLRDLAKAAVIWFCCIPILQSMYRRALNGGCFKYSLTNGLFRFLAGDDDSSAVWDAAKGYLVFVAIQFAAVVFMCWCWNRRGDAPNYIIALILCICCLAAFDIFIYVLRYREARQRNLIRSAVRNISGGDTGCRVDEGEFSGGMLETARSLNNISAGLDVAVTERVKADRLKADLITNVSHDIRTPLTSIINYVDLLKRENVENTRIQEYIDVLDKKSSRLKKLTDDLIEASKASSGNIKLDMQLIDMVELASQAGGEFEDRFRARNLELNLKIPDSSVMVLADGRYLWRVFENLYSNAAKYSMEGTRVYAEVTEKNGKARFTIKNISADRLNISPDELTERFIRGDVSRNTEGSGLGLNIAESLVRLMGGELVLEIDGDLYKANVILGTAVQQQTD